MRSVAILVLAILFTITTNSSTNAAALWWSKVITRQKTYQRCMQAAQDGGRGLGNLRISPNEVSGTSLDGKVYVAITCVERGADLRAVAIIAGVGDDVSAVRPVVDNTAEAVRTSGIPEY